MPEAPDPSLTELLRQLPVSPAERAAFAGTDPEATATKVRLLTAAAHYFNAYARLEYGGRPGSARDRGLVEQVVAAAFQTYAGEDPHPAPFDKAAMLLRGITRRDRLAHESTCDRRRFAGSAHIHFSRGGDATEPPRDHHGCRRMNHCPV